MYEWNYGMWVLCYWKCTISLVFAYDCAWQFYNSFVSQMEVLRKTWHKIRAIQWKHSVIFISTKHLKLLNWNVSVTRYIDWIIYLIVSFIQPFFSCESCMPCVSHSLQIPFPVGCCLLRCDSGEHTDDGVERVGCYLRLYLPSLWQRPSTPETSVIVSCSRVITNLVAHLADMQLYPPFSSS